MDEAVSALTKAVLRDIQKKGLDKVDLWYLVGLVSSMVKVLFSRVMERVLETLDQQIFGTRDVTRYRVKRKIYRSIQTLSGSFVYCRRYYKDRETGKRIFLLDEALGVQKRSRLGPDLGELCAGLGAFGLSYRKVADVLELVFGERVMSHEEIREHTLKVGRQIKAIDVAADDNEEPPEGHRECKTLFIEADGFWLSRQGKKGSKRKRRGSKNPLSNKFEVYMVVTHEGWRKRYQKGKGESQRLIRPRFHVAVSEDEKKQVWEKVRGQLYRTYKRLDDMRIVINGDAASWIRQGTGHFRNAIYQCDRFHVSRDLRAALRRYPQLWEKAKAALDRDEINELCPLLAQCLEELPSSEEKRRKQIVYLMARIERDKEYIIDYRKRIEISADESEELRGLGAAEPSVKRFKNRMKSVGKSWSEGGADAIAQVLARYFSSEYSVYLDIIARAQKRPGAEAERHSRPDRPTVSAAEIGGKIKGVKAAVGAIRGSIAALRPGYSGMARMFRKLTA